ncbi:iron ABC transporter permease [Nocardioides sp. cx-173]|uniref:ABC transporter permease n=1 Tax=Nocardioides sp. cx-173 TaxID=2898796 RepID=UPI001E3C1DD3|nr:iron ABC transporter permease [Nocardioides sp. cx-173]MCD4525263.1 iron ABC transporter permease [Nocardioides sp. cx-173]UGB40935.1 iron ABC transporter permease [Nocardioides sp. cx-173]
MTVHPWEAVRRARLGLSGSLLALLSVLIVLPVGFVVLSAFTDRVPRPGNISLDGLSLDNFETAVGGTARHAAWNSLVIGLGAAVIAVVIGFVLAFLVARTDVPFRRGMYLAGLVPLFLPSYVGALAWAVLASPAAGLINVGLRDLGVSMDVSIYNMPGLIFVLGIYYAPYPFLLIHGSLSLMNPDLEDAASMHGASFRRMLRTVTLPLTLPATLGSAVLVFVLALENFPVAALIGNAGRVDSLPAMIYRLMNSQPSRGNEASALALLVVLGVLALTAAQRIYLSRSTYTTVSGKGIRPRRVSLGLWRYPALGFGLVYLLVSVVLPLLALLLVAVRSSPYMSSFAQLGDAGALTAEAFREVADSEVVRQATINSVVVGVSAAAIGLVLAFAVSYVSYRTTATGRQLLEYVGMIPLAVPHIVLGLGLLWTWLLVPIPVYGTLAVLVIAFVAAQMPQGLRGVGSSILQVDRELEDSAVMHGATRLGAIRRVTVPLMRDGLTSTFLLLLMLSMRELTVPLFLFTTDTRLVSIVIFDDFENGAFQRAAALCLVYCGVLFVLSTLARRLGARNF